IIPAPRHQTVILIDAPLSSRSPRYTRRWIGEVAGDGRRQVVVGEALALVEVANGVGHVSA
ncbi:hypothetical protein, partial [Methylobacterium sp.]|uniref:hypothetical protein n=1 Tax=Methylobacterium sp. TaxID=409 RepID=UPI0025871236